MRMSPGRSRRIVHRNQGRDAETGDRRPDTLRRWVRKAEMDRGERQGINDVGSQQTSIAFTNRLLEAGVDAFVGSAGDDYDYALAVSQTGPYRTDLNDEFGPVKHRNEVEAATIDWVCWFNTERPAWIHP